MIVSLLLLILWLTWLLVKKQIALMDLKRKYERERFIFLEQRKKCVQWEIKFMKHGVIERHRIADDLEWTKKELDDYRKNGTMIQDMNSII